jgi:hypothetical protein
MMHTVHFSIAVASGTNLTYRLHGQVILNRDLAAHISHVPDTGELTRALIAVGLPPSIVARGCYEVGTELDFLPHLCVG